MADAEETEASTSAPMDDGPMDDAPVAEEKDAGGGTEVNGSPALRPVFLGNLDSGVRAEDISKVFESPVLGDDITPVAVERLDLKRGFCFVFLKDVATQEEKERAEAYVSQINGISIPGVSSALRSEFARGDGRTKRKEDERRKKIQPSETLFVVNFHEETTKREDLQMLFEPYGELVRIDMKRNYAFVQFTNTEQAKAAKEATNGGKLDQSIITVEYVARRMGDKPRGGGRDRGGRGRYDDRRGGGYRDDYRRRDDRYDDRRRDDRFYDDRRGGGYRDDYRRRDYDDRRRSRSRSPGHRRGGRSRSRSRSPGHRRGGRSRSPSPRYERGGRGYSDRDRGYN